MRVTVIGSGIVGLATAYQLARRGCEVTVVGNRAPGAGASTTNAGWVVPALSGPVPAPGLVLQALRWMLQPDSPVFVRPSASLSFLRFMVGMARACTPARYAAAFAATAELGRDTMTELDRWAADGLGFEMHASGELQAYVDGGELRRAVADLPRYETAGFEPQLFSGAQARVIVPQLSDAVVGAIRFPNERHVRPASLVAALHARLVELGARHITGEVTWARPTGANGGGVGGVCGGAFGEVAHDAVVIAAGAWTGRVVRLFGASLPIRPAKGYSIDYEPAVALPIPVMLAEAHCVLTPLDGTLRVAGTMEFGGLDERISARRVEAIRRAPQRYLRDWRPEAPSRPATAGLRPMTPDGLPVIGRLATDPSVYVASGHAMLGLTLAPRTAALLAGLIVDGLEPEVLRPFAPRRFGA